MKLNVREKRLLIAAAVIGAMIGVYYIGSAVVPSRTELASTVEQKKRILVGQKEVIGREETYKARVEKYRQRIKQDVTRFLPGDNPSIAGAELQKALKDLADQNGVEIIRKDIQRESKLQDGIFKVQVKIETNCAPEQLVQFLVALENYERFLTIDELVINSFRIQKRYEIRPSITVTGYIMAPESQPATKTAAAP